MLILESPRHGAVTDDSDALTPAELAALDPDRIDQETDAADAALQRAATDWRHIVPSEAGDPVERAIRRTAVRGGRVQGAATIGKSRLDIHGGVG